MPPHHTYSFVCLSVGNCCTSPRSYNIIIAKQNQSPIVMLMVVIRQCYFFLSPHFSCLCSRVPREIFFCVCFRLTSFTKRMCVVLCRNCGWTLDESHVFSSPKRWLANRKFIVTFRLVTLELWLDSHLTSQKWRKAGEKTHRHREWEGAII